MIICLYLLAAINLKKLSIIFDPFLLNVLQIKAQIVNFVLPLCTKLLLEKSENH